MKITILSFLLLAVSSLLMALGQSQPPSHAEWTALLKKNVTYDGWVNYAGFQRNLPAFNQYLQSLSQNPPQKSWSKQEQLAYWINAYNAFTVQLILKHYPLKSIKDIKAVNIPFVSSPWDIKFIKIGDQTYDLNYIEHSILRKQFDEPRIHFAINCASISCPNLRNEAYTAQKLEQQLEQQTKSFIDGKKKNHLYADQVKLSPIFQWFKGDFTQKGSLIDFLNRYSTTKIQANAQVNWLPYDWNLNGQ